MLKLSCVYSKKIGLPSYSSHQFSITLETELADVNQVQQESARLYRLLQDGVDSSIQQIGYLPGNGNGNGNGHSPVSEKDEWKCSPAQKDLILKIVEEHHLDKNQIEKLAIDRFSLGVKSLNKLQASSLIEELLEQTGQRKNGRNKFSQQAGGR